MSSEKPPHPEYIQLYPTLRCNETCDFCFNRLLPPARDISIEDFAKMVAVFSAQGIGHIDILGGEPTLHPQLAALIDTISSRGLSATLSSNGSRPDILQALSEAYSKEVLRIGISVNSDHLPKTLQDYIFRHRPILKSIFTKDAKIPESCRPYIGLPGIEYYLLYMDVIERRDLARSLPFYTFHDRIRRLKTLHEGVDGVFCSGFIGDSRYHPVDSPVRCPAGTTKLSVLPDGTVYPCYLFFRDQRFALGNILCDEFSTIWGNPVLEYFRTFDRNRCPKTECELFASCHGGCPAMALLFHQDIGAPDPRCINDIKEIVA